MEFIDEDTSGDIFKYVDDLTMEEAIEKDIECVIDNEAANQVHVFRPPTIQENFDKISESCKEKGLLTSQWKEDSALIYIKCKV